MGNGVTKTLSTTPDERGMVHRVVVKDNVIERGKRKVVCPALLMGSWRAGEEVVVKILDDAVPDEEFWLDEIAKCKKLRKYIAAYRNTVKPRFKIRAEYPMTAYVDKVSKWMKRKLQLKAGEFVLVEDRLDKSFSVMLNSFGKLAPKLEKDLSETLGELMHFTYHDSDRKELFCGFQGVFEDEVLLLVEPTVHSVDESYRETDQGLEGILLAFDQHKCTSRCREWLKPDGLTKPKAPRICTTV